jgi:hypothetical protein
MMKHQEKFESVSGFGFIWEFLKEFGQNRITFNHYTQRRGLICTETIDVRLCSFFASGFGVMQEHLDECSHHDTMEAVLYLKNDPDRNASYYFPFAQDNDPILLEVEEPNPVVLDITLKSSDVIEPFEKGSSQKKKKRSVAARSGGSPKRSYKKKAKLNIPGFRISHGI